MIEDENERNIVSECGFASENKGKYSRGLI